MKKSWIVVLLLAAGLATQGAQAAVISLDLTTANPALSACGAGNTPGGSRGCLESGDTASAGGLTVTFSSVTPVPNTFSYIVVDEDGIWFDNDPTDSNKITPLPSAGSFGISFSQDVFIKSYVVGFDTTGNGSNSGGFDIAGLGVNNMFGTSGAAQDFANPSYLFIANTVYTVVGSADDLATLETLNVETRGAAVPEPATLALFGLGLAGLGAVRRRKRAA